MTGMLGANTDGLRELAGTTSNHSEVVRGAESTITPEVSRTDYWFGPDADAFRGNWKSVTARNIQALAARLDEINNELVRQAAEQDEASSANGNGFVAGGALADAGLVAEETGIDREALEDALKRPHYEVTPMENGDDDTPASGPGADEVAEQLANAQSAQEVADIWNNGDISGEVKQEIIEKNPDLIRNRDGIPLNDRASANQQWAKDNLERIRQEHGADSDVASVVEQVAKGGDDGLTAVYLDPPRDIITMHGKLDENTERVVIHNPQTGGKFGEFALELDENGKPKRAGGYLGIPEHLASNDDGTVVLVNQKGDWAKSIADIPNTEIPGVDEGPPYANDAAVYDKLGQELAQFQRDGLLTDPNVTDDTKMVGMGFSFGNSVTTASEMHGAKYDSVISIAGANTPNAWRPNEGTTYTQFQYDNDFLNLANTPGASAAGAVVGGATGGLTGGVSGAVEGGVSGVVDGWQRGWEGGGGIFMRTARAAYESVVGGATGMGEGAAEGAVEGMQRGAQDGSALGSKLPFPLGGGTEVGLVGLAFPGGNPDHSSAWDTRNYGVVHGDPIGTGDVREVGAFKAHQQAGSYDGTDNHANSELYNDLRDEVLR